MTVADERIGTFLSVPTEITYHLAMQDSNVPFDEWFKHISSTDKI